METIVNREEGLPGIGVFYGEAGRGKSRAANYAANKFRAHLVQMKSRWTCRHLCEMILAELDIPLERTVSRMIDKIGQELSASRRPLMIDDAGFMAARGMLDIVWDIHESGLVSILLLGETDLPILLKNIERIDSRVLKSEKALEADASDAALLARLRCRGIEIAPDLMKKIRDAANGSARRLSVNFDRAREKAALLGCDRLGLAEWAAVGDPTFYGVAP